MAVLRSFEPRITEHKRRNGNEKQNEGGSFTLNASLIEIFNEIQITLELTNVSLRTWKISISFKLKHFRSLGFI